MQINYEDFHFDEKAGLRYKEEPVSEFNLCLKDKKLSCGSSESRRKPSYLVEATYTDGRSQRKEWVDDLRNLDLFGIYEINDSFLPAESRRLLLSKLMYEASRLPGRMIFDSYEGLQTVCGVPVYVAGEHIFCYGELPATYEVATRNTMQPVRYEDRKEILKLCRPYFGLMPGTSEILFYGSLFAVVKPFLSQLRILCGFLLSLVAPPGHLKTTLVRNYALWLNRKGLQETSFCSRQRDQHILNDLNRLSGQNFLIDDLHRMPDSNEKRRQERRLDIVSRHVDAAPDCANVILTGETMEKMGIFSCMDRIFQVRMPKMDAKEIEALKKRISDLKPDLMASAALMFARSLMENYNDALQDMKDFYDKNRINNAADGYATRMHRHAMFIRMTAYLFEKYVCRPELMIFRDRETLDAVIREQISQQESRLQKLFLSEEPRDYIVEFFEIIMSEDKYIKVHSDVREYQCNISETSCLLLQGKLYINGNSLKKAFFRRYEKYVPLKSVIDAFHKEGVLEEEAGSKGRQKNFLNQKHYVIGMCYLIGCLRKKGYPVSEDYYEIFVKQYL